ncbi:hypothetical protein MRX96_019139 [Rhipicephalus microplus]
MLASSATPFSVKDILNLSDSGVDELDPQALLYQAQSLEKAFFEEACHEGLLDADALLLPAAADSAAASTAGGGQCAPHLCLPYHAACFEGGPGFDPGYAQHDEAPTSHLAQHCGSVRTDMLCQQLPSDAKLAWRLTGTAVSAPALYRELRPQSTMVPWKLAVFRRGRFARRRQDGFVSSALPLYA